MYSTFLVLHIGFSAQSDEVSHVRVVVIVVQDPTLPWTPLTPDPRPPWPSHDMIMWRVLGCHATRDGIAQLMASGARPIRWPSVLVFTLFFFFFSIQFSSQFHLIFAASVCVNVNLDHKLDAFFHRQISRWVTRQGSIYEGRSPLKCCAQSPADLSLHQGL